MGVENIKVEAMKVYYGEDKAQVESLLVKAGIAKADLAAKYFKVYAKPLGVLVTHVFWFNVTGADVAPVIAGVTLHEIDISDAGIDTAGEIAVEIAAAMGAVADIDSAVAVGGKVTWTLADEGYVPAAQDATPDLKKTNFGFIIETQGEKETEVGCIEGDIEVAFEESFLDVTCHAEGITPVAQLKNGVNNVEVTVNLQETTTEQLKTMFVKTGGSHVPEGGEEVFGMGTFKNFENMFKFASKLRLHPVRLLDGDLSEDWTFHKAIPNLTGVTFSGENVFTLPVTFRVYPAQGVNGRVNYFSRGNSSQNLA